MQRCIRLLTGALLVTLLYALAPQKAQAGELVKPIQNWATAQLFFGSPVTMYFILQNKNASFALGIVRWTIVVRYLQTQSILFQMTGEVNVGKDESVTVDPGPWTPAQTGAVEVTITANSESNITGEQVLVVQEEVQAAQECPRPTVTPSAVLIMESANTITYTAPLGCCFRITPFINTGVWYNLSPASPQTISDGASVTFTVTPKDAKPMASVLGFAWVECETGKPAGKDYIVVTPTYPANSGDSTMWPGVAPGHLYRWYSLFGDPVSPYHGGFVHSDGQDIGFRAGPVHFARSYNSRAMDAGMLGSMGLNWSHTYDASLKVQGADAILDLPFGNRVWFTKSGVNWTPRIASTNAFVLSEGTTSWTVTDVTRTIQYTFDATGRLTRVDDGFVPVHIAWNGASLKSASDSMGHTLTFTSDTLGRITGVSDGSRAMVYTYSANSELLSATEVGGGDGITYTYDAAAQGRLATISRTGIANIISNTYDTRGYVVSQVDANGNTWTYTYGNGTSTVTDGEDNTQTHTFSPAGFATSIGTTVGATQLRYDASGRPTSIISAEGDTTRVTWHSSGQVASRRSADGATTSYTYAARMWNGATVYDLSAITHPDGAKTEYKRDARGHATEVKGPTGGTTVYTRHAKTGYITSEKDPLNRTTLYAYNASGQATSITSPTGAVTGATTNALGDITALTLPDASTYGYMHDAHGRVILETNENNNQYAYTYDKRGNLTNLRYPSAAADAWTYGKTGELKSYASGGRMYTFDYDDAGRLSSIHDPANSAIMFTYDAAGNISQATDRTGATTRYGYDKNGALTSSITPLGNTTLFERDAVGRITSVRSPLGNTTTTTFNSSGDVSTNTDAVGRTAQYSYDARGLLTRLALPNDVVADYTYDASGSITKVTDPMRNDWVWGYDAGGRVTSITNPLAAATTYTYDTRDRVTRVDMPNSRFVVMTYDKAGNMLTLSNSEGAAYTYGYDVDGNLTSATGVTRTYDANGALTMSNGISITRDANGRIATMTFAPGKTVTYAYDAADRVTSITDWTSAVITFTRDTDGKVTGITRPNNVNTTITFDNDGHSTRIAEGTIASTDITRDAAGRVQRARRTGLLEPILEMGESTFTYDAANAVNEPHTINPGTLARDAFGRVVSRVQTGNTRTFSWNDAVGEGVVAGIGNGTTTTSYVVTTPDGMVVSVIDAATSAHLYPHYSESGNTVLVTNDAGQTAARYAYSAYGEVFANEGVDFPFLFGGIVGTIHLGEGAYAMGPRVYDAKRGRFTTEDPISSTHPVTMNVYQYANEDPVNYEDWSGRSPQPQPSAADEIMRASNQRLEEAMQRTKDEYDARMRELEQRSAERRAEREASEKAERDARERLEREQQAARDRERADREAFDRAQKKAADLNDIFLGPPPTPPTQPRPVQPPPVTPPAPNPTPAPAGGGGSKPTPTPAPAPAPAPTPTPAPTPGGGGGGGRRAPAGGAGRGSYLPDVVRDFLEYFIVF